MKKKVYIVPILQIKLVKVWDIIVTSTSEIGGPPTDEWDAHKRRDSIWDDYE